MPAQARLLQKLNRDIQPGQVEWIGLRPARKEAVISTDSAMALEGYGLEGDRRCKGTPGSGRQVTLIMKEHLPVLMQLLNIGQIDPALLRRNILVSGINLYALRHQAVAIGDAEIVLGAHCHPCSPMNEALGPGTAAAMLGHGGFCAKITRSGLIRVGDPVTLIEA